MYCQRYSITQWCSATLTLWPAFPLRRNHFCTNGRRLSVSLAHLTDQGPVLGVPGHTSVPIFDLVSLLCSPERPAVSAQRDSAPQVSYKNNNRGVSSILPKGGAWIVLLAFLIVVMQMVCVEDIGEWYVLHLFFGLLHRLLSSISVCVQKWQTGQYRLNEKNVFWLFSHPQTHMALFSPCNRKGEMFKNVTS